MGKSNLIVSKFSHKKRNARNGWVVADSFSGKETGLWEMFINMFLASSVKTGFDRKCSVVFFTQRQMKEINL